MKVTQGLPVSAAVEGPTDEALLRRILEGLGLRLGPVHGKEGKDRLLHKLPGYNVGARFGPWIVLVDLDQDGPCPGAVRDRWLSKPAPGMCLRIAVRAAEAWLLADHQSFSSFFKVRANQIPPEPDAEQDPKRALLGAIEHSTSSAIRADLLPRPGSGRRVGPSYVGQLIEFIETAWEPGNARMRSTSLARAMDHIGRLREFRTS